MADTVVAAPVAAPVSAPAEGGLSDSQIDLAFAPDSTDTATEDVPDDIDQPDLETPDEPDAPEDAGVEGVGEGETPPAKAVDPTVPEGVTVRETKSGKKEWVFPEERGKRIYDGYKLTREAEQLFGEEVTMETLGARNRAYNGQLQLQAHFLSGDPQYQDQVIEHFVKQGRAAVEAGEATQDPMESFSGRMPEVLLRENPRAFYAMRESVLSLVLPAIIREAVESGSKDLVLSAQHIQNRFFGKYDTPENVGKQPDELAAQRAELARERAEITKFHSERDSERVAAWKTDTKKANLASIEDSVAGVISDEVKNGYKSYPENFEALKDRLRSRVIETIRGDSAWQSQIARLRERALLSRSEQTRADATKQLANMHRIKATGILESIAPPIISEYTRFLKERSDATHARRTEAATRREPGSAGAPIQKSLVPSRPEPGEDASDGWARALNAI